MDARLRDEPLSRDVRIFNSGTELAAFAAEHVVAVLREAIRGHGGASAALSGGTTPGKTYERIAEISPGRSIHWGHVHLFWGDERCVPPDDERSNFRLAYRSLICRIPIPRANVHRMRGELLPQEGAEDYERELGAHFGRRTLPSFDLLLLGLGADGHTASLFPESSPLSEASRWVTTAKNEGLERLTLTLPVLNAARSILFIVTGREKAEVAAKILSGESRARGLPAAMVRPQGGKVAWFLDAAAASLLGA